MQRVRGQSNVLAIVVVFAVVIALVVLAGRFVLEFLSSNARTGAESSIGKIINVQTVTSEYNSDTNLFTVCAYVRATTSPENNILLTLKSHGRVVAAAYVSAECLSGKGVCPLCSEFNIPDGEYTVFVSGEGGAVGAKDVMIVTPPPPEYPSADLRPAALSFAQSRYGATSNLLHGDYNSFTLEVNVCNDGPRMASSFTVSVGGDAHFSTDTIEDSNLPSGTCRIYTFSGDTTAYGDGNVSATVSYVADPNTSNDSLLTPFFTSAYFECNSLGDCQSDISSAQSSGVPSYVLLTADIACTSGNISVSGDASSVVFDGNGHDICSDGGMEEGVLYLSDSEGLVVRNMSITVSGTTNGALRIDGGGLTLNDVNLVLGSYLSPVYCDTGYFGARACGWLYIDANNSYCKLPDNNMYKILSFDGDYNGMDLSPLIEANACFISVHHASGIQIHDINIGHATNNFSVLYLYSVSNFKLDNVFVNAGDGGLGMYSVRDGNIVSLHAIAWGDAPVYVSDAENITLLSSKIGCTADDAIRLEAYGVGTTVVFEDVNLYSEAFCGYLVVSRFADTIFRNSVLSAPFDEFAVYSSGYVNLVDTNVYGRVYLDSGELNAVSSRITANTQLLCIYLSSKAALTDTNFVADSHPFSFGSGTVEANNTYCIDGNGNAYPVYTFSSEYGGRDISPYIEENACAVFVTSADVVTSPVLISDMNLGVYGFSDVLILYDVDANIMRSKLMGNTGIFLSSATAYLTDSDVNVSGKAVDTYYGSLHLFRSHIFGSTAVDAGGSNNIYAHLADGNSSICASSTTYSGWGSVTIHCDGCGAYYLVTDVGGTANADECNSTCLASCP